MSGSDALLDVGEAQLNELRGILRRQIPGFTVWAFGSRARRTAKPFSDLDLAVAGEEPMSLDQTAALKEALAESDLPWKVDVVDLVTASEAFRRIVERDKVLVSRGDGMT